MFWGLLLAGFYLGHGRLTIEITGPKGLKDGIMKDQKWLTDGSGPERENADPLGSSAATGYVHKDMEHWAEEYECAMMRLDCLLIPRLDFDGKELSLVGRIDKALSLVST